MENWGLVTYRETCLLVDPKETSASNRQWVALVVCYIRIDERIKFPVRFLKLFVFDRLGTSWRINGKHCKNIIFCCHQY